MSLRNQSQLVTNQHIGSPKAAVTVLGLLQQSVRLLKEINVPTRAISPQMFGFLTRE